ncbi:growth hormone-regulated TBC protein 1 isoform X1 [Lingula anatina]|uniref:Growth hormone-regulated TBC protein 1 n=1 Tax=Lingula anatina TaxID=7574 RepID=A0A1S3I8X5_LINAN|nr:growth hormone-regulated TBC protein 1 isoform X1 [Lingula anatina]|eukprot:XP_013393839.1 growth hormone-regulated TBC protein 1 isoform X1 [Lingula anatina]
MAERSRTDQYGFEWPEDFDFSAYDAYESSYIQVLARRSRKWKSLLGHKEKVKKNRTVKRYVRKGIPKEFRPLAWMTLSGAQMRMDSQPQLYQHLLTQQPQPEVKESIDQDLHRTFPENIYFCDTLDPTGLRQPLCNVLTAFALKNPKIGYCQGFNFIVGVMLLILRDEQKTFWLLDTLITQILPDLYSPGMAGLKAEIAVLAELIRQKEAGIYDNVEREGVPWAVVFTRWFICLFIDVLPIETVLRIWDCLFYEGVKVLHRVGITLVLRNKEQILHSKGFDGITKDFKATTTDIRNLECHQLMQDIFTIPGSFPRAKIQELREKFLRLRQNRGMGLLQEDNFLCPITQRNGTPSGG